MKYLVIILLSILTFTFKIEGATTEDYIKMVEKRDREAYSERVRQAQNRSATFPEIIGGIIVYSILGGVFFCIWAVRNNK
jgi:UDP-N-acetylmuramyl pentapeptide phosphotransferase/UDP-N-acetylglucosamine-1-phosphate transferase